MLRVIESDFTIYLAGPMTGIENYNKKGFDDAKKRLHERGYDKVISPRDLGLCDGMKDPGLEENYKKLVRRDLCVMIEKATWVILIPGWENSKGANLEKTIAELLDIPVFELKQLFWQVTELKG